MNHNPGPEHPLPAEILISNLLRGSRAQDERALFYFETSDGSTSEKIKEGFELDGMASVRAMAKLILLQLAEEVLPEEYDRTFRVIIRDEKGREVLQASLTFQVTEGGLEGSR
jgi:hypothetical protein